MKSQDCIRGDANTEKERKLIKEECHPWDGGLFITKVPLLFGLVYNQH